LIISSTVRKRPFLPMEEVLFASAADFSLEAN
jgi:hypothetical protein